MADGELNVDSLITRLLEGESGRAGGGRRAACVAADPRERGGAGDGLAGRPRCLHRHCVCSGESASPLLSLCFALGCLRLLFRECILLKSKIITKKKALSVGPFRQLCTSTRGPPEQDYPKPLRTK